MRFFVVLVLSLSFLMSQPLFAQGPITSSELRDAVRQSAEAKQKNLDQVRAFFADPNISKALSEAHIDSRRIEKAMSALDAAELAKLAARTVQIQNDFAAGALTNQELTYVVIAIAAAVLVLIVVAA
jgi:hypothetical protein